MGAQGIMGKSLQSWLRPTLGALFIAIEHSENRISMLFGLFENEIGPGVLQLTFKKYVCCKKTKGTKSWPLKIGTLRIDDFWEDDAFLRS